jgi:hypothetical protein
MKPDMTLDDISQDLLRDCAALVKANSIQGCKKNNVYVVYTRWKNLKKTASMVDGQVGFHRPNNVRRIQIEKHNSTVRQIDKTKEESHPDLFEQQQKRLQEIQRQQKEQNKKDLKAKQEAIEEARREKELRSYDRIMTDDNMSTNKDVKASVDATAAEEFEDDFF